MRSEDIGCGDRSGPATPQSLLPDWLLGLALVSVVSLVSLSASSSTGCCHFLHDDFFPIFISVYTPPFSFLLVKIQAFNQDLMHIRLLQDILFSLLVLPDTLCLLWSDAANVRTESSPAGSEAAG